MLVKLCFQFLHCWWCTKHKSSELASLRTYGRILVYFGISIWSPTHEVPAACYSHTGHPFFTTNTPKWNLLCTYITVVWYRYTMRVAMVTMRLQSCSSNTEPVSMWLICGSLLLYTKQPPKENMKSANFYWRYVDGKYFIALCIYIRWLTFQSVHGKFYWQL